jgi:probable F420-dependent oxidoreductase
VNLVCGFGGFDLAEHWVQNGLGRSRLLPSDQAGMRMMGARKLRFATTSFQLTRDGVLAEAHLAESLGYDTFVVADHLYENLAPFPTLMVMAKHTGLRVGTCVLCNDFRHPLLMAKDAATLDVLSDGRFELGLGAGYQPPEYQMAGIPFDRGRERFDRLAEAVRIVKLAFAGKAFSFDGAYYQVREYTSYPKPAQSRLPLMLGGGGRRLLSLAAAEADIVSVLPAAGPGGLLRATQLTTDSLREKIAVLRAAAPDRWTELEVNILIFDVTVTTDRRAAAAEYLAELDERLGQFTIDGPVTVDDLLDSPCLLFGTVNQITEQLQLLREVTGVSYLGVFPHCVKAFAPIMDRLN